MCLSLTFYHKYLIKRILENDVLIFRFYTQLNAIQQLYLFPQNVIISKKIFVQL